MKTKPLRKVQGLLRFVLSASIITCLFNFHTQSVSAAPLKLSFEINLQMFALNTDGSKTTQHCFSGSLAYGCTALTSDPTHGYPYSSWTPTIPIETDYLLDVVAQEMSPEIYGEPEALEAQAIVSRSYVNYFIGNPPPVPFNNSAQYQVFIPYRFEKLTPINFPENQSQPCISQNLNSNQRAICNAVSSENYISLASDGNILPAKALFHADSIDQTWDGTFDKPYLVSVDEPISQASTCDANNEGERYGFSQEGANRWAWGNLCSRETTGDLPWSVHWDRAEQILVHYFTGVNILNSSSIILTSPYRWNPLSIYWGASGINPPIMYHGQSYAINVQVQNTSIFDWPLNGESWALSYHWSKIGQGVIDSNNRSWAPINIPKGDPPYSFSITINDVPSWGEGEYSLQFDIVLNTYGGTFWFSRMYSEAPSNWLTYNVTICVDGPCRIYLPITRK